jgi:hypothetical protein
MSRPDYSQVKIFKIIEKELPQLTYEDMEALSYSIFVVIYTYEANLYHKPNSTRKIIRTLEKNQKYIDTICEMLNPDGDEHLSTYYSIRDCAFKKIKDNSFSHYNAKKPILFFKGLVDDLTLLKEISNDAISEAHEKAFVGRKTEDSKVMLACEIGGLLWEYTGKKPSTAQDGLFFLFVEFALETTNTRIENIYHVLKKALDKADE